MTDYELLSTVWMVLEIIAILMVAYINTKK